MEIFNILTDLMKHTEVGRVDLKLNAKELLDFLGCSADPKKVKTLHNRIIRGSSSLNCQKLHVSLEAGKKPVAFREEHYLVLCVEMEALVNVMVHFYRV